jgi:hypothetical protein
MHEEAPSVQDMTVTTGMQLPLRWIRSTHYIVQRWAFEPTSQQLCLSHLLPSRLDWSEPLHFSYTPCQQMRIRSCWRSTPIDNLKQLKDHINRLLSNNCVWLVRETVTVPQYIQNIFVKKETLLFILTIELDI